MSLQVIGAGLPRTGTASLKASLEQLLGGPCYHMFELFERVEEDGLRWFQAMAGEHELLDDLLQDWVAAVDWPASTLWRELMERNPDALVVLSHRGDAQTWWKSVDATVWATARRTEAGDDVLFREFNRAMFRTAGFGDEWSDQAVAMARYDSHFAEVVDAVPADRLVLWQPEDGWDPLCAALGLPVPDGPPVHTNTRTEFRDRAGLEPSADQ
ncbi:MAG: sulfotransferase family protein [Actinomycetota bacterium]